MTEYHHVTTDTLEAIAFETGARVLRDDETDRRWLRIGSTEFWARPSADVVLVPVAGRATR